MRELAGLGEDLETGLVSYWKLGGASPLADSFGTFDLTNNNAVTTAAGVIGDGSVFDGVNQNLSHLDDSAFDFAGNAPFTVAGFFKIDGIPSGDDAYIISKTTVLTSPGESGWSVRVDQLARLAFTVANATTAFSVELGTVTAGQWHWFAAWYDDVEDKIYVQLDGVTKGSTIAVPFDTVDTVAPLRIGAVGTVAGAFFDGMIDEVGVWGRVLTAAERASHRAENRPHFLIARAYAIGGTSNLLGYWPLQETSGTTAYDISGNLKHGTYLNGPTLGESTSGDSGVYVGDSAVHFNGTTQSISLPSVTINNSNQAYLFGLISPDDLPSGTEGLLQFRDAGGDYVFIGIRTDTGHEFLYQTRTSGASTSQSGNLGDLSGTWARVLGRQTSATARNIRVDGTTYDAQVASKAINLTAVSNRAAKSFSGGEFDGRIQHLMLFDIGVSDADDVLLADAITESGLDN